MIYTFPLKQIKSKTVLFAYTKISIKLSPREHVWFAKFVAPNSRSLCTFAESASENITKNQISVSSRSIRKLQEGLKKSKEKHFKITLMAPITARNPLKSKSSNVKNVKMKKKHNFSTGSIDFKRSFSLK